MQLGNVKTDCSFCCVKRWTHLKPFFIIIIILIIIIIIIIIFNYYF